MIDWDAVRRRGARGMLTAQETDALATFARLGIEDSNWTEAEYDPGIRHWYIRCALCGGELDWDYYGHADNCPIAVLERITEATDGRHTPN